MDVDEKILENSIKVGAITKRALNLGKGLVKEGVTLLSVAEAIEDYLRKQGCGIAFPVNLSVNDEAAHYTPKPEDDKVFGPKDVVKVDIGAEMGGALSDCALTVDISGENSDLVEAAEAALANAISVVRAGVAVSKIGKEIERTIESYGFTPIRNLGGHGVEPNNLHAEPFIPNYDDGEMEALEEGMIVSIEPFATNGKGMVVSGEVNEIFSFNGEVSVRLPPSRKILSAIMKNYPSNPFASRWLYKTVESKFAFYSGIQELIRAGAIEAHPVLMEAGKGLVSQAEVEILVEKDGCRILTKE
jgi:methionyl aminopeptidase